MLGIHVATTSESNATKGSNMETMEPILKTQVACVIAIPKGALIVDNTEDKAVLRRLTGLGLNIAALPRKSLQYLQDNAMRELRT